MAEHQFRLPIVAGRFYPADPAQLRAEVEGYLARADEFRTECAGQAALGCMLPHAGYMFSGLVAGLTLGQIEVPDTVLLLAPNHTGKGLNLALWPNGTWRTPLGEIPVDEEAVDRLVELGQEARPEAKGLLLRDAAAHREDHALEVILPFLQVKRPDVSIIPLSIRGPVEEAPVVAEVLARFVRERRAAGREVLLLTSSDMSHYLPQDEATLKDRLALEQVARLDGEGLMRVCLAQRISMCGFLPMSVMLLACRELGATRCCITAHTNSGVTGKAFGADSESVVGYAGAIVV